MTTLVTLGIALFLPALSAVQPDSVGNSRLLKEIQVKTVARRTLGLDMKSGQITIDGRNLGDEASLLASPDIIGFIRSNPAVATSNDLQATVSVRGGSPGDNRFMADMIPVFNPVHMLGLFSSYNPAFYRDYTFMPGRISAVLPSSSAALFQARSVFLPDTIFSGSVTAGLIESHGALNIPLVKKKSSLSFGARKTYLDLVFPKLLTLRNSTLYYGVSDFNVAGVWRTKNADIFRVSALFTKDNMRLNNGSVARDGKMGWGNIGAGMEYLHNNMETSLSFSHFHNRFFLQEGGRDLKLPSSITMVTARALLKGFRNLDFETDLNYIYSTGQSNLAITHEKKISDRDALRWNTAAAYKKIIGSVFVEAGLRMSLYHTQRFTRLYPLPRVNISWNRSVDLNFLRLIHAHWLSRDLSGKVV